MQTGRSSKPLSLTERAIFDLRAAILHLDHPPGSALRLDALQQRYGLSSSPLREALSRLVADGLVVQDSNRGFRVAEVSLEAFRELTEVRLLIEPETLRRSVREGDEAWEGRVVAAHHQLRRAEEDLPQRNPVLDARWAAAHQTYHFELLSGCQNARLRRECVQLFSDAERYRQVTARIRRAPRDKNTEHTDIMTAALARDEARAAQLLREHIQFTAEAMAEALHGEERRGGTPRILSAA